MGQTLTHGVYLPDEGERNCYSGLAANWSILDGAVGTVAEHSTQIAGKAPLVHTHTKSDITDFPAYGTTAGTICEGNDSRLSDARTPVAHTHGKADVTDLFNSANTWDGSQTFVTNPAVKNNNLEKGVAPSANSEKTVVFTDKNDNQISYLYARMNTNGESYVALRAENLYKNGAMDSTGNLVYSVVFIGMDSQGNPYCVPRADLYPDITNRFNLGTLSKKWKTLNGINPGALSLPKTDSSITSIGTSGFSFDGTSERIPDTINVFSNGEALINGWLCARIAEGAGHYIFLTSDDAIGRYGICSSCFSTGIVSTLSFGINVYVPIKAGDKPAIRWAKPNGGNAQLVFYPCFGNV